MDSEIAQNQYLVQEEAKEEKDSLLNLISLKNKKQFDLVNKDSKFFVNDSFKILSSIPSDILPQADNIFIGFKITKKIAGSVGRNKIRRRIKSIFRNLIKFNKNHFHSNQAFIIIAKKPIIEKAYNSLNSEILNAIRFIYNKLNKNQ